MKKILLYLFLTSNAFAGTTLINRDIDIINSPSGSLTVKALGAGVVHSNINGLFSASSIINTDIANTTIDLTAKVTGILPIANGGTNNATAYTAGSIIYSDGTSLTQDNTGLHYYAATKHVVIGSNIDGDTSVLYLHNVAADNSPVLTMDAGGGGFYKTWTMTVYQGGAWSLFNADTSSYGINLDVANRLMVGNGLGTPANEKFAVKNDYASEVTSAFYSIVGQTADLTDWYVNNILVAHIDNTGKAFFPNLNISSATASTLAKFDASKNIISATSGTDYVAPGADINTSGQVTSTHLSSALPVAQGGTNATSYNAPAGGINPIPYWDGTRFVTDATVADLGYNPTTDTFYSGAVVISGATTQTAKFTNTAAQGTTGGSGMQGFADSGAAMISGNRLGFYSLGGAKDAAHTTANSSLISAFATETWNAGATGSDLEFEVTANGGTTRTAAVVIGNNGAVKINNLTASELVATDASKNLVSVTALPNGTTATTQTAGDNSTKVATTAYVDTAVAGGGGSAKVGQFTCGTGTPDANTTALLTFDTSAPFDYVSSSNYLTGGSPSYGGSYAKFGASGAHQGGGGGYVGAGTCPSFGTANFEFDVWAKADVANQYFGFMQNGSGTGGSAGNWGLSYNNGNHTLYFQNGSGDAASGSYTMPDTNYHHYEVDRSSGVTYLFADGVLLNAGGTADTYNYVASAGNFTLGLSNEHVHGGGGLNYSGSFDELRFSNIARHTASFTPPTSAYAITNTINNNPSSWITSVSGGGTVGVCTINSASITTSTNCTCNVITSNAAGGNCTPSAVAGSGTQSLNTFIAGSAANATVNMLCQ